ncbi:MAG: LTA synthase family protein [Eubacterium sp.]|nr:LTA synthase family protein [Eubacterium sp.]
MDNRKGRYHRNSDGNKRRKRSAASPDIPGTIEMIGYKIVGFFAAAMYAIAYGIAFGVETVMRRLGFSTKTIRKGQRTNGSGPSTALQNRIEQYVAFPVIFIYLELLLRGFCGVKGFPGFPIFFAIFAGIFVSAILRVTSGEVHKIISRIFVIANCVYFCVEFLIYRSFQNYMGFGDMTHAGGDVATNYGIYAVRVVFFNIPKIILFILPAVIYILATRGRRKKRLSRARMLKVAIVFVIALLLNGIGILIASKGPTASKYTTQYNFDTATKTFGLLTSTRLSLKYGIFGKDTKASFGEETDLEAVTVTTQADSAAAEAESVTKTPVTYGKNELQLDYQGLAEASGNEEAKAISSYVVSQTPSSQNEYTGLFKGKNLIMICAEAFSDAVVSEEMTPTLYRLIHNGFYFTQYFQPAWGGSTSTGEYSFMMGLAPEDGTNSMMDISSNNNYFTMGNQFQRLGYTTAAFHNSDYDYYDRQLTHPNMGYSTYLGEGNGIEDITDHYPTDETMLSLTLDQYIDKQPFHLYYMTVNGHAPYNNSTDWRVAQYMDHVLSVLGDDASKYNENTLNYMCYQMELEDALTALVNKLEANGMAENTVIALTTDHYPYGLSESESWGNSTDNLANLYQHDDSLPWDQDGNGLIIWSGCLETTEKDMAKEINSPVSSLDIVPTLSNLFGLDYDSRLLAGRDVFSDQTPLVFWNNTSWVTDLGRYYGGDGTFYPNEGVEVPDGYVDSINQIVQNKLILSENIVSCDYYGILFGPDPETGGGTTAAADTGTDAATDAAADDAATEG